MSPDTIARMEARGWKWDAERHRFRAAGGAVGDSGRSPITGTIYRDGRKWCACYGFTGVSWGDMVPHPTPDAAADEAEAWFRHVVSGLPGVRV